MTDGRRDHNKSSVPNDLRNLRACLLCSLIKTYDMFEKEGCDNCEEVLQLKDQPNMIDCCTSSNFEGMIALMHPEESWVAKWQRISHFAKGMYAVSVTGSLPKSVRRRLAQENRPYRSRDLSLKA